MAINPKYKPPKTGAGELKTPVSFYVPINNGPEPVPGGIGDPEFECTAEVYKPSMKDLEVMKVNGVKNGMTIIIRDPLQEFQPQNDQRVKINDYRYAGKIWEVIEVRPDIQNNQFVTILLGVMS